MLILGLETSCDETAAAVVQDGTRVRSNVVASQILVHAEWGGVVPEVASRQHLATVAPTIRRALSDAGVALPAIDGIAVTCGPGLVGALLVGVETAKALGYALGKPVVGVNHLRGHMAAARLCDEAGDGAAGTPPVLPYPHVALLVSGGHTALYRVEDHGRARTLGATRDDAAGEAFDKVGKVLGLGYPGGVAIDRLARAGDAEAHRFPRALRERDDLDFSFSGLKTALATFVADRGVPVGAALADVCASFQAAVVDVLVRKARRAIHMQHADTLVLCGGVAANSGLRAALATAAAADGFALRVPPPHYCTDNAAMIAAEGSVLLRDSVGAGFSAFGLEVDPALPVFAAAASNGGDVRS